MSTPGQSRPSSMERSTEPLSAIPHMSTPRCAVGCANLNNTLLVCGKSVRLSGSIRVPVCANA